MKKSQSFLTNNCYVADDDPPKPMPEVEDPQEEADEQVDDGEVENEERWTKTFMTETP